MIPAAKFDRRLRIERRQAAQDSFGQPIQSWSLVAPVWANVKHVSGVQAIKADSEASLVRASIRVRYRTDLESGMRLVTQDGTAYAVQAVLPNRAEGVVDLVCEVVR